VGRVDLPLLAALPVDLPRSASQPEWAAAVAGMGDLLVPAGEAVPGSLHGLQEDRRVRTVAKGPEVGQVVRGRIAGDDPRQLPLKPTVPDQLAISPQQTCRWKEQVPERSHARRVQPGQA